MSEALPNSRVVCHLNAVTPEGYIVGWAREENKSTPSVLQFLQNGSLVAETVADSFRLDLLEAGIGHYGFYARLHDVEPGEYQVKTIEKHSGAMISVSVEPNFVIPIPGKSRPTTVHDILRRRQWAAINLVQQIGCLRLPENLRVMGPHRFVDVTHMFLLDRWMDDPGLRYVRQLETGEIGPDQFFIELALSEDRVGKSEFIPGPYDGRFPYKSH